MSMSFLSTVEAELPPGFRFHPRDDELICDYLVPKVSGKVGLSDRCPPMIDVDLNKVEPWDLPAVASVGGKQEWYFFSLRDRKYATGQRTNRATVSGYWKATGKDRAVARRGAPVGGMRKTLVFYQGRAPKGRKTEWVMHEYRLLVHERASNLTSKEDWVLCRVICKKKSGGGGATSKPRNFTTIAQDTSTATSSPPLPPLMDTTLAQLQATMNAATTSAAAAATALEQVPCFSSFNNNIASNNNSATVVQPCYLPMVTGSNGSNYLDHGLPAFGSYLDPALNCDKKLLKAVLSQLSSMGGEVVPSLPPEMAAAVSSTWMNHF